MPHVFYGVVYVGDEPAPAGLSVEARCSGVTVPLKGNPILTTSGGLYGGEGSYSTKLVVQGAISDGTPIEFYVNGARAEVFNVEANGNWTTTYPFHSTGITELNLKITAIPGTVVPTTTPTSFTPTTTSTYNPGQGGGGGGGGGGGSIASSVGSLNPVTTSITPTTASRNTPHITEEMTTQVTSVVTTASPTESTTTISATSNPGQSRGILQNGQLILYGAAGLIFITIISLIVVGKYKGWWGGKPPEKP